MNMQEALEWAADYADRNKLFEPVANQRGYADHWKPPSPEDKRAIITQLAKDAAESPSYQQTLEDWHAVGSELANLEVFIDNTKDLLSASRENDIKTIHDRLVAIVRRNRGI